jgi:hypothetical protein
MNDISVSDDGPVVFTVEEARMVINQWAIRRLGVANPENPQQVIMLAVNQSIALLNSVHDRDSAYLLLRGPWLHDYLLTDHLVRAVKSVAYPPDVINWLAGSPYAYQDIEPYLDAGLTDPVVIERSLANGIDPSLAGRVL